MGDGVEAGLESYLPPYVRRRVAAGGPPPLPALDHLPGAVVLADISGFTSLSERLADDEQDGAEALFEALNGFFSGLIDLVVDHGGEVLAFAGDALLAYWPAAPSGDLGEAVRAATGWAQVVAAREGRGASLSGADLAVRLAMSSGMSFGWHLGGVDGHRLAAVSGRALEQVSRASRLAGPGDIVLDAATREHLGEGCSTSPLDAGFHRLVPVPAPAGPTTARRPDGGAAFGRPLNPAELAAYIPPHVLEQEESGRGEWLAEVRPLTMLFIQLTGVGYQLLFEDAQAMACAVQAELARYGATVNKMSVDSHGTALPAAAGLPPLAHDDDPVRAVRAALAVSARLDALGWSATIGVTTGRVFCGPVGNSTRREYTVLGGPVNLAARLAQEAAAAPAGGSVVLCDQATFEATRHEVEFAVPLSVRIKGISGPVVAHRALARRQGTAGRGRLAAGPLLGRDEELRVLRAAVEGAERGVGGVVLLFGEPGIGKSRLLHEVADRSDAAGIRTIRAGGDPVERVLPYHAWRAVFEELLGLAAVDAASDREASVREALPAASRGLAALLNPVLGLDQPDSSVTAGLVGDSRLAATRALLVAELRRAASVPLVLVLDDAHWFDSASWALAVDAARQVPGMLLLVAARTSDASGNDVRHLAGLAACQILTLPPLSEDKLVELASRCLGTSSLPETVADVIVRRAAGVPFFAEELAYTLRDAGRLAIDGGRCVLVGEAADLAEAVPGTVEAALASRVGALDTRAQLVLKVASVVGPTFSPEVVADVYPVLEERAALDRCFELLVERDLILVARRHPETVYAFRHSLTRDAVYRLMLGSQRQELHQRVAEWHEARAVGPGHSGLHATLGHHWSRAGDVDRGSHFLGLASAGALDHGLAREAVDLGLDAVGLLGVMLPRQPAVAEAQLAEVLAAIDRAAAGRSLDDLLSLPPATDRRTVEMMGLLLRIQPAAYMSQQDALYALMGLRNFLLTLEHGGTPFTAGVVSIYATLVRFLQNEPVRAFALSMLAKRLAERDAPAMSAYAGFVHSWLVHHWTHPIATDLPELMRNAHLGLEYGDVTFAGFNAAAYVINLGLCGTPLDEVDRAAESAALIAGSGVSAAFHCRHEAQVARALAGRTIELCSLTDSAGEGTTDEERDLAWVCGSQLTNQKAYYLVSKLRLHYYAGCFDQARRFAAEAAFLRPSFAGQAMEAEYLLFAALAELAGPFASGAGREELRQLREWQAFAPMNFRHKSLMVEGEMARKAGSPERAAVLLVEAAASARAGGFPHHEALAFELAAGAQRAAGEAAAAGDHLASAMAGYRRWGAHGKAEQLERYY